MSIMNCFPAGGGSGAVELNITAYSAVGNLPASDDESAIAIITSTAINDVYSGVSFPTSPSSGDIFLKTGVYDTVSINITDELVQPLRAAYQYNGSNWDLVDAYVYKNSAWLQLAPLLYSAGTFYLNSTCALIGSSRGSFALTSTSIRHINSADANGGGYVYSGFTAGVDLTGISTIRFTGSRNDTGVSQQIRLCSSYKGTVVATATLSGTATSYTWELDVSSFTGTYYIGFYTSIGGTENYNNYSYVTKVEFF